MPTFIQEAEIAWSNATVPKATASFNVLANDVLVAFAITEGYNDSNALFSDTPLTLSGGTLTWTMRQSVVINDYTQIAIWTATVDTDKAMTASFSRTQVSTLDTAWYGGNCLTFRGASGVGASSKTNVASGAPTLNITTTQANSSIVVANGDFNAVDGASRTWRSNAGTLTEQTYFRDASHYTVYGGYHADAGAAATYAVGLSAPGAQKYAIVAVEITQAATLVPVLGQDQQPFPERRGIVSY